MPGLKDYVIAFDDFGAVRGRPSYLVWLVRGGREVLFGNIVVSRKEIVASLNVNRALTRERVRTETVAFGPPVRVPRTFRTVRNAGAARALGVSLRMYMGVQVDAEDFCRRLYAQAAVADVLER